MTDGLVSSLAADESERTKIGEKKFENKGVLDRHESTNKMKKPCITC